jgi:hypothetical protein
MNIPVDAGGEWLQKPAYDAQIRLPTALLMIEILMA